MSIIYFALLLGGLIFFHELGHFLLARWMGVHVVTFSIGFGPTIFSFKGRKKNDLVEPTEYVIAALPLGGYVRMLGDDPMEEVDKNLEAISFQTKPIWRRFLIVSAGPAFNLILPFIVFFFLHLSHTQLAPSTVGTVVTEGPAWKAGVRAGDRLTSIDGKAVNYWWQVIEYISARPGDTFDIGVQRGGSSLTFPITAEGRSRVESEELDIVKERGRIGIAATYTKPVVAVRDSSVAHHAGLRSWDKIVSVNAVPVERYDRVERLLRDAAKQTMELSVIRYESTDTSALRLGLGKGMIVSLPPATGDPLRGITDSELLIRDIVPGSPAAELGLRRGDRVLSLDGDRFPSWGFLIDRVGSSPKETEFTLRWERENDVSKTASFSSSDVGSGLGVSFRPVSTDEQRRHPLIIDRVSSDSLAASLGLRAGDELLGLNEGAFASEEGFKQALSAISGESVLRYARRFREGAFKLAMIDVPERLQPDKKQALFGASVFSQQGVPDPIENEEIFSYALHHCVSRTMHAIEMNFTAIMGLFSGKVPLKELGGPILIGQLAAETEDRGWAYFFRLMVWLSVSLGLINLLPIPILDGGHILFLAIEGIRRKPVSLRTRQVATYAGFAFIILLMVLVFKNDIERSFFG
jgi:membrane-associated protease RseP (regulator of RpoE activity)